LCGNTSISGGGYDLIFGPSINDFNVTTDNSFKVTTNVFTINSLGIALTGQTYFNGCVDFNYPINIHSNVRFNTIPPSTYASNNTHILVVDDSSGNMTKTVPVSGINANNIYSFITVANNVTLTEENYVILVDTTGSVTITLPSSPSAGLAYKIKDVCGCALVHPITICAPSPHTIDGSSTAMINTDYGSLNIMADSNGNWFVLGFVN